LIVKENDSSDIANALEKQPLFSGGWENYPHISNKLSSIHSNPLHNARTPYYIHYFVTKITQFEEIVSTITML